ncbi:hypothetical protein [Halobaculum sp. EA56]|uniref:hypothetical protein n=1 Tax=Halobaculum sp. EA56 TaxID=3421648 RepID=UPI003EB69CBB
MTGSDGGVGRVVAGRPFGYVEPGPVIRRLGARGLSLGNEHAADPTAHDRAFDAVVSLTAVLAGR